MIHWKLASLLPILVALIALFTMPASAAEYTSTVVGVHDGDTLTLLTPDKRQIKVRLAEIDPNPASPTAPGHGKRSVILSSVSKPASWCRTPISTGEPWGGYPWVQPM